MKKIIAIYSLLSFLLVSINTYSQIDGDNLFKNDQVVKISLEFSQPNFWDTLVANYEDKIYIKADLTIVDSTGTYEFNDVGIRLKGNSSYDLHPGKKKSFKIDFNKFVKGQKYDGIKKLNLNNGFNDPTFMREKIFFDVCKAADINAPRANYANVYFNGELKGFFTLIEQIDDQFLDWRIEDDKGNMFKAGSNFAVFGSNEEADLKYYGTNKTSYEKRYQLKTNKKKADWTDFIEFLDFVNNSSESKFEAEIEDHLELQEYLRSLAIDNIFSNLDSYTGSARNYYIYHNLTTDKWEWIKWDGNASFGIYNLFFGNGPTTDVNEVPLDWHRNNRPLIENIFKSTKFYNKYLIEVCYIKDSFFNESYLNSQIIKFTDLIKDYVYADTNKQFTNEDFDNNIEEEIEGSGDIFGGKTIGLKSFIKAKISHLDNVLDCSSIVNVEDIHENRINISPNPTHEFVKINWNNKNVQSIFIYNSIGNLINKIKVNGINETEINVSNLTTGLYFISINSADKRITRQLIISK